MTAKFTTCSRCKAGFIAAPGQRICPACKQKEDEQYILVKEFLDESPGTSADEVAEATGVPVDLVMKFVREGRLRSEILPPEAAEERRKILNSAAKARRNLAQRSAPAPRPASPSSPKPTEPSDGGAYKTYRRSGPGT